MERLSLRTQIGMVEHGCLTVVSLGSAKQLHNYDIRPSLYFKVLGFFGNNLLESFTLKTKTDVLKAIF